MKAFPTVDSKRGGVPSPERSSEEKSSEPAQGHKTPLRKHAPLLAVIEALEPRAMLAGVGPESWSAPGLAPAPLGTGVLSSSGIILTCSSPAPGSSGTASPPAPTSGSGGTTSGGDLWDSFSVKPGAGSSSSSSDEGSLADNPTISAKYTGGSGGGPVFFVTGATGADAANSESQQRTTGSTTLTLADGQSPVMTTPLVYQPGSDDGPGVVSGVWTGGDGGWQVILMSDGESSYDDGAPDGEPQDDPWPLRLSGVTGFSQFKSMGEPGWGDDVPVFRPGDVEAARGLTGLAKMVHDHGLPVSRRAADSNGRVVVYTFTDGTTYMEPVEPPSEQYIDSAAVMVPGGIALSRGKGLSGAARAIAAEAIDDAATSRASQAANVVTGGSLKWIPAPIASILFGGKLKPRVSGVVDDAADAGRRAGGVEEAAQPVARNSTAPGSYRPNSPLPRGPNGGVLPSSPQPHTQLGTEIGRKVGPYTAAREFGSDGQPIRDIHFTDHGRPNVPGHINPHQHRHIPNPTGGTPEYGPAEPFNP